mmetsp:Transcript_98088/g.299906  ORF Transcript_98088/g.299906 Transcript_98088/m.299906 type:complete len:290 (+) Transcript_98088:1532-2401(+)
MPPANRGLAEVQPRAARRGRGPGVLARPHGDHEGVRALGAAPHFRRPVEGARVVVAQRAQRRRAREGLRAAAARRPEGRAEHEHRRDRRHHPRRGLRRRRRQGQEPEVPRADQHVVAQGAVRVSSGGAPAPGPRRPRARRLLLPLAHRSALQPAPAGDADARDPSLLSDGADVVGVELGLAAHVLFRGARPAAKGAHRPGREHAAGHRRGGDGRPAGERAAVGRGGGGVVRAHARWPLPGALAVRPPPGEDGTLRRAVRRQRGRVDGGRDAVAPVAARDAVLRPEARGG